jgi:hypothetical protein
MTIGQRFAVVLSLLVATAACDHENSSKSASAVVQRDTVGDTIIARSSGPGVWGDSVRLTEELRIGGDGGDNYSFGNVVGIAADEDGTIYVADDKREDVRSFDSTGRYIAKLGRKGKGPGEYLYIGGIAGNAKGKLFLWDFGMSRVNVYLRDGKAIASLPCHGLPEPSDREAILMSASGDIYIKDIASLDNPDKFPELSFVHCDSSGIIRDTMSVLRWPQWRGYSANYDAFGVMTLNRRGELVSGYTGRYEIEIRSKNGKIFRIDRAGVQHIPIAERERHYLDSAFRALTGAMKMRRARHSEPAEKPFFRELSAGEDNRIWITLYTPSIERPISAESPQPTSPWPNRWYEPSRAWDVFEPDGVYLGRVTLPHGGDIFFRRGMQVWGKLEDENGTTFVVRWRIRSKY